MPFARRTSAHASRHFAKSRSHFCDEKTAPAYFSAGRVFESLQYVPWSRHVEREEQASAGRVERALAILGPRPPAACRCSLRQAPPFVQPPTAAAIAQREVATASPVVSAHRPGPRSVRAGRGARQPSSSGRNPQAAERRRPRAVAEGRPTHREASAVGNATPCMAGGERHRTGKSAREERVSAASRRKAWRPKRSAGPGPRAAGKASSMARASSQAHRAHASNLGDPAGSEQEAVGAYFRSVVRNSRS